MAPSPRGWALPAALAALLVPQVALAQISVGPHGGDVGRPASRPSGGSGPVFSPSLSLTFTLPRKPKPFEARDASLEAQVPDAVIFIVKDGAADPQAIASRTGVSVLETVHLESLQLRMVVGKLHPGDTPEAASARLAQTPGVAWAQADHVYQGFGLGGRSSKALEAQGLTPAILATPAAGTVAMIDTPLDLDHEALRGVAVTQRLFVAKAGPGVHGTAVAGLMVGRGDVVAPGRGARLVSLAAFLPAGDGARSQTRSLARALDAAALLRPNVLNLSFGGPDDRLLAALLSVIDGRGVCVAAAAGNGGKAGRVPFPASHPAALGVTAVDERLRIYPFATPGPQVDVAAIGVDVTVAAPGGYRQVSGSSFATAVVSGALLRTEACAKSRDPGAMRAAVSNAAKDLGAVGRDDVFGGGLFRLPARSAP
ncbi:S8 family serine peptidase [Phenylobacterium sp.]|uniref:S8 family serine peptidase n=1 Tax=Phenylobacterium sp. TaxID=1871053 RepID=UPI002721E04F|nr:S8 family serine peptidase [Phenylobacterium sp.]MDO8380310.1 S8 family serine peptidase [Phenylobacterium sp.]